MAQGVITVAEQRDGEIRKISYEIVSEGRRLADSLGQELTTILLGSDIKDKAPTLGHYGADKVLVADDPRLETYTIEGAPNSGEICINGPAARLISKGDRVIILSYATISEEEARRHTPRVVLVDERNRIVEKSPVGSH